MRYIFSLMCSMNKYVMVLIYECKSFRETADWYCVCGWLSADPEVCRVMPQPEVSVLAVWCWMSAFEGANATKCWFLASLTNKVLDVKVKWSEVCSFAMSFLQKIQKLKQTRKKVSESQKQTIVFFYRYKYSYIQTNTPHTHTTCSRFPERGSMSLIFLSLQVVARRLPSVLKDMERTTSAWWLIVRTGFFMTDSGQSRFQIITCRVTHIKHTHTLTHTILASTNYIQRPLTRSCNIFCIHINVAVMLFVMFVIVKMVKYCEINQQDLSWFALFNKCHHSEKCNKVNSQFYTQVM